MASLTSAFAPAVTSIPVVPGLPLLGNLLQFRRDRLSLQDDAARIGPITRLQLAHIPVYVVTDAELAHEVLVTEASSFKKSAGLHFLKPMLGDGLLTAEGEPHRRHRKLLAPAFAPRRLAAYGEVMAQETARQVATWRPGQAVDLAHEMMELTLAIAGRTMFGADVRGDASTISRGLELAMRSQVASLRSPLRREVNVCLEILVFINRSQHRGGRNVVAKMHRDVSHDPCKGRANLVVRKLLLLRICLR